MKSYDCMDELYTVRHCKTPHMNM